MWYCTIKNFSHRRKSLTIQHDSAKFKRRLRFFFQDKKILKNNYGHGRPPLGVIAQFLKSFHQFLVLKKVSQVFFEKTGNFGTRFLLEIIIRFSLDLFHWICMGSESYYVPRYPEFVFLKLWSLLSLNRPLCSAMLRLQSSSRRPLIRYLLSAFSVVENGKVYR